jgi:hypothetical protein
VWFLGDPLRTDMALFDPANVLTNEANPWRAAATRRWAACGRRARVAPDSAAGWMVGEGGRSRPRRADACARRRTGLDHGPIEAFVRRRPEPATF